MPEWTPILLVTIDVVPALVQQLKSPVSNPPFPIPPEAAAGQFTVSVTVVLWVVVDGVPVPVTVTTYEPVGVVGAVLIVSVELPPDVMGLALKFAAAPLGSPLALSVTDCAEPFVTAVETVLGPLLLPWVALTAPGLALIEKSFAGGGAPQPVNLNEPIRVFQLKAPLEGMY